MFVKICGITRMEDAQAATELGADAIGFVFWRKSPRFIEPDDARTIVESLPRWVSPVGVFVNQPVDEVNDFARRAGLTGVQLHGEETSDYAAEIECPLIKAFGLSAVPARTGWPLNTLWLIDVHDPEVRGGTGRQVDWSAAAEVAADRRVLLAGGLKPETVGDAVSRVRPFGIDVSSGVESAPGKKDRAKLDALFKAINAINHH